MIKLSFEVPLSHLDYFDGHQDFLFALSCLCPHKEYVEYIRQSLKRGLPGILDNSFNEVGHPEPAPYLVGLAIGLGINRIVAPDSLDWTFEEMRRSVISTVALFGTEGVIAVARSPLEVEYFQKLSIAGVAIPYRRRHMFPKGFDFSKTHFLGLNSVLELVTYRPESCDTGMPVKLALQGKSIEDWIEEGCPHIHNIELQGYFQAVMTEEQLALADENIKYLKEVCK